MSKLREQVAEFHRAMGAPTAEAPTLPSKERILLRLHLIAEEFAEFMLALGPIDPGDVTPKEFADACVEGFARAKRDVDVDMVLVADALADLDYVIEGTRLEMGIDGGPIADEVHRSNMSKLGTDGKPVLRDDGKITKGPNYSPPDIAACLRAQGWTP